jgi:hypothetical protein
MIRLALAVGFLSVFGIVAYAIVLLLTKKFNDGNKEKSNSSDQN